MAEDLKVKNDKNGEAKKEYTGDYKEFSDVTLLNQKEDGPRDWKNIAEVRMVMYVVPVAIVFLIAAYLLSKLH